MIFWLDQSLRRIVSAPSVEQRALGKALGVLANGHVEGKLLLLGDLGVVRSLAYTPCVPFQAKAVLTWIANRHGTLSSALPHVSHFVRVVGPDAPLGTETVGEQEIISVPIGYLTDSRMAQHATLLCENQTDGIVYKLAAKVYRHYAGLDGLQLDFAVRGGGGSDIASQFRAIGNNRSEI